VRIGRSAVRVGPSIDAGPDSYGPFFHVTVYDLRLHSHSMENHYNPQLMAEAAMRLAVAADGPERQKWISLAIAWQELARATRPTGTTDKISGILVGYP
jgi:hypothetical protein